MRLCRQVGAKGQQESLCRERVTCAAFQLHGRVVECCELFDVAVLLDRAAGRPEEVTLERWMSFGQCLDRLGVDAKRDDKRMLAPALQSVAVAWAQEYDAAFIQGLGAIRQVVPDGAVLHPEEFEKVVIMQAFGPRGGQCCPR